MHVLIVHRCVIIMTCLRRQVAFHDDASVTMTKKAKVAVGETYRNTVTA